MTVRGWRSHVLFFQWARCIISRYPNNGLTSLGKLHKRMKMWVRLSKSCICLSLKHCCTRKLEKKKDFTSLWKNVYLEMWRILQDWDHKTYNLKKPELKPVKGLMSCSIFFLIDIFLLLLLFLFFTNSIFTVSFITFLFKVHPRL